MLDLFELIIAFVFENWPLSSTRVHTSNRHDRMIAPLLAFPETTWKYWKRFGCDFFVLFFFWICSLVNVRLEICFKVRKTFIDFAPRNEQRIHPIFFLSQWFSITAIIRVELDNLSGFGAHFSRHLECTLNYAMLPRSFDRFHFGWFCQLLFVCYLSDEKNMWLGKLNAVISVRPWDEFFLFLLVFMCTAKDHLNRAYSNNIRVKYACHHRRNWSSIIYWRKQQRNRERECVLIRKLVSSKMLLLFVSSPISDLANFVEALVSFVDVYRSHRKYTMRYL